MTALLHQRIMRGVYRVYLIKKLTGKAACRWYLLAGIFAALQPFVSFSHVIRNAPRAWDPMYYYDFGVAALSHTENTVRILTALLVLVLLWMGVDVLRGVAGFLLRTRTARTATA